MLAQVLTALKQDRIRFFIAFYPSKTESLPKLCLAFWRAKNVVFQLLLDLLHFWYWKLVKTWSSLLKILNTSLIQYTFSLSSIIFKGDSIDQLVFCKTAFHLQQIDCVLYYLLLILKLLLSFHVLFKGRYRLRPQILRQIAA